MSRRSWQPTTPVRFAWTETPIRQDESNLSRLDGLAARTRSQPGVGAGLDTQPPTGAEGVLQRPAPKCVRPLSNLDRLEIASRRFSSAPVLLDLIADLLAIGEGPQPGAFNGRYMNENVRSASVRLDEPKALCRIKPLHRTCSHASIPLSWQGGQSSPARRQSSHRPEHVNDCCLCQPFAGVFSISAETWPSCFWSSALQPARRGMRVANGRRTALPFAPGPDTQCL